MIKTTCIKGTSVERLLSWFKVFEIVVMQDDDMSLKNVYNADESEFSIRTINASRVIVNTDWLTISI